MYKRQVLCKLGLSLYQSAEGKRTGSTMLSANAVNMRNDAITSASVLLGLVFTFVFELPVIDSIMSILVSCLILWSAFRIFMDSNVELMDGVRDTSVYQKIFEAIDRVDGVSNPHRVRSRTIGGKYMITLDVEADAGMTLMEAHTLASQVENEIRESIPEVYDIVVHVEPCGTHPEDVFGLGGKG
ncbi:MAG TPA: cation transporter [Candidatus Coprenecus stercoripullorum]|nr:cation transporter [Candidatus Coprenecus stercoripullorum]